VTCLSDRFPVREAVVENNIMTINEIEWIPGTRHDHNETVSKFGNG
jgi:hypothetical protein